MIAVDNGHEDIAMDLMKAGADITLQDKVCHNILYVLLTNYFMEWLCMLSINIFRRKNDSFLLMGGFMLCTCACHSGMYVLIVTESCDYKMICMLNT